MHWGTLSEKTPGVVVGETEMASWGRRFLKLAGRSVQWCLPEMGGGRKKEIGSR